MNLRLLQSDPSAFRRQLIIDADGTPVCLSDVLDPWQESDFAALDPAWRSVAGHHVSDHVTRAWLERPRGHSKTQDLAVMAAWVMFAARSRLAGYAAAADTDQARLLRDSIERLVRLNPWLSKILKVQALKIQNIHTGSTLEILSSDAPTSYGLLPDFVICDEVVHWKKPDLWESLISSAAKRKNCVAVVITNAGFGESWQWNVREAIRNDPRWYFSRLDGPQASWITPDRLAEQRKLLPDIAYRRLWLNEWTAGVGDALTEYDINAALTLSGPLTKPEKGWIYVAGLDLGLSRDRAALAVVGRHVGWYEEPKREAPMLSPTQRAMIEAGIIDEPEPAVSEGTHHEGTGRLKLARLHVWAPADGPGGKVEIGEIEDTLWELDRRFRLTIGCDPWQAAYLVERLQKRNVPIETVDFVGQNLKSMCSAMLEAFSEGTIDLYPDADLRHDLRNLRVVEKSYGVRLESPRGPNGHGDAATALAIALHLAKSATTGLAATTHSGTLVVY